MTNKIELLAPAGNFDAFTAAVECGADAVYLGGRLFNARQFAGNFDSEQLKKALDYAHTRNTKIYLAMNTLIADSEMQEAIELAGEAYSMGIDGIIVQDLGFAGIIRRLLPELELHASTQMTTYNLEGVKALAKLGFKRVVLARELSLNEIEKIAKGTDLEIEVFIHGALCISYSGQCLMSSMIGGRSGNRGKCAQPCRLPYELVAEGGSAGSKNMKGYLMSPKDLCSVEDIQSIITSGVKSLKIEGRMKTPEYVATVVRIYRKYIDRALEALSKESGKFDIAEQDRSDLTQIFNRGGLAKGYLHGKTGRDMMCYEKPKNWGISIGEVLSSDKTTNMVKVRLFGKLSIGDGIEVWNGEEESPGTIVTNMKVNGKNVGEASGGEIAVIGSIKGKISAGNKVYRTSEKALNERAKEVLSGKFLKRVPVTGEISVVQGRPILLKVWDKLGNTVEAVSEIIPEAAVNKALTEERVIDQLMKTGSTPFDFEQITVEIGDNLAIPVSELNSLRRKALEELEEKSKIRYYRAPVDKKSIDITKLYGLAEGGTNTFKGLSLFTYKFDSHAKYHELGVGRVYIPFSAITDKHYKNFIANLMHSNVEAFLWLPGITKGRYDALIEEKLEEAAASGISGFLAGSPSRFEDLRRYERLSLLADFSLNTFNSYSIMELAELGVKGVTLSPELTLAQINGMKRFRGIEKEALVYGRVPLMTSEYCPVGSIAGGMSEGRKCNNACLNKEFKLKDRMGMEFPVLCDRLDCRSIIFNSNVLFAIDQIDKIKAAGVGVFRIIMTDESFEEIKEIINLYKEAISGNGKLSGKHKEVADRIKSKGFTKGHFFRGV